MHERRHLRFRAADAEFVVLARISCRSRPSARIRQEDLDRLRTDVACVCEAAAGQAASNWDVHADRRRLAWRHRPRMSERRARRGLGLRRSCQLASMVTTVPCGSMVPPDGLWWLTI